jgi:hypothetical protein
LAHKAAALLAENFLFTFPAIKDIIRRKEWFGLKCNAVRQPKSENSISLIISLILYNWIINRAALHGRMPWQWKGVFCTGRRGAGRGLTLFCRRPIYAYCARAQGGGRHIGAVQLHGTTFSFQQNMAAIPAGGRLGEAPGAIPAGGRLGEAPGACRQGRIWPGCQTGARMSQKKIV